MDTHSWPSNTIKQFVVNPVMRTLVTTESVQSHSVKQHQHLPIPPHPPGQVVTAPLCFNKDDRLVLLFAHDFLEQTDESDKYKKRGKLEILQRLSRGHLKASRRPCIRAMTATWTLTCFPSLRRCKHPRSAGCCGWR